MTSPQDLVEQALALSTADGCIVMVHEVATANLRWANNTLTTNGVTRSRLVHVTATVDGARGTAAGSVTRTGAGGLELAALVEAAEAIARSAPAAEDAQPFIAPSDDPEWDLAPADTSIGVFSSFAPSLGAAMTDELVLFGFASHVVTTSYLGTSTGLRLRHSQTTGQLEINGKSPDRTRSAWMGLPTTTFTDIDMASVATSLATRLDWARRTIDLPAGRYETVLPPSAVADLLIYLYWSAGGRDAHEGQTVFSKPGGGTRVGERLSPLPITLSSDPRDPGAAGMACAPFTLAHASSSMQSVFDNGFPLDRTEWISNGTLRSLIQTRHSASLTGLPVTPEIDNLTMVSAGATGSLESMIAATPRGILLTCLWYIREVDPQTLLLTGLTRDGVYLVEGGEVTGAVNNFRFNESPVTLLSRIAEVGASERTLAREWSDYFTRTVMPPIRVPDFNMSSVSAAS